MTTAVVAWGRMNPPTIGHQKLVDRLRNVARMHKATPLLYLSQTHKRGKDPLTYNDKIKFAQRAFGRIVQRANSVKTIIQLMKELEKKYDHVILVCGDDRYDEFHTLLNKYNGKDYSFKSIKVMSAGVRDPDAEGAEGMSASKLRSLAADNDFDSFKSGLPPMLQSQAATVYKKVQSGL